MNVPPPRRRALLLGCRTFADVSLAPLRSPLRDVEELSRALRDPFIGRYSVQTEVDCTSQQAQRAIEGFFAQALISDGMNLLYLSCHGVQDASGRLYFAFADTETTFLSSTAVAADWVRDRIYASRSRATAVLVDCCFSGGFIKGMQARSGAPANVESLVRGLPEGTGVAVLTASGDSEVSFEATASALVRPSYFTDAVVTGISTGAADLDQDGRITVDELYQYVYEHVVSGPSPQRPRKLGVGEGSLVIAETAAPKTASSNHAEPTAARPVDGPASSPRRRAPSAQTPRALRLVDAGAMRLPRTFGEFQFARKVRFSGRGDFLVASGRGKSLSVFSLADGSRTALIKPRRPGGHYASLGGFSDFDVHPVEPMVAGIIGPDVVLYNVTGEPERLFNAGRASVNRVAFNADGLYLMAYYHRNVGFPATHRVVTVWETVSGARVASVPADLGVFSGLEPTRFAVMTGGTVEVRDIGRPQVIERYVTEIDYASDLFFVETSAGEVPAMVAGFAVLRVATGGADEMFVSSYGDGATSGPPIYSVAMHPQYPIVAIRDTSQVSLVTIDSGSVLARMAVRSGDDRGRDRGGVDFDPEGRRMAMGVDNQVKLWELQIA